MAITVDILIAITGGGAYNIMFASVEDLGLSRRVAGTCIGLATIIAYSPDAFMYVLFGNWLDKYGNDGYTRIFAYSRCSVGVGGHRRRVPVLFRREKEENGTNRELRSVCHADQYFKA